MEHTADKVYRNAKIYSVALDGREIRGEAIAIKDGKFAYVGDEAVVPDKPAVLMSFCGHRLMLTDR